MKSKFIHVLMLIVGILGLFMGTLPDIFPDQKDVLLIGKYKKMNVAYEKLVNYAKVPRGIRESEVALNIKDSGYHIIYNHLQSLDPSLPSLKKTDYAFRDLLINQVVHVRDDKNEWRPICELRDLYFIIRDSQLRYFTIVGFAFALFALAVEFFMNMRTASNT